MKKLLIALLLTNLLSSPVYGMWSAWTTGLASATQFARKQMAAFTKSAPNITLGAAKTIQKPVAKIAQNLNNTSSLLAGRSLPRQKPRTNEDWWDKISNSLASAWNSLKQNMKLPQWFTNSAAKEQIKKTLKTHAQKLGTRAPMIGGALAAAGMQTAHAQGKQPQMPAFTVENIFNYRLYPHHRSAFIAHAVQNIATKDKKTIEAITEILKRYPESHVPITQAALGAFNDVQPGMLKEILAHNACAKDEFVKKLLTQDNPHLDELFTNYIIEGNSETFYDRSKDIDTTLTRAPEYDWAFGNGDGTQFGIAQSILESMTQNPAACSVHAYNTVFKRISSKSSAHLRGLSDVLQKKAIVHYGQDAATFIRLASGKIKKSDVTYKPLCIYYGRSFWQGINIQDFTNATLREITTLSIQDIQSAYEYARGYEYDWYNFPATRIQEAAQKRFGNKIDTDASLEELIYIHSQTGKARQATSKLFYGPAILKKPIFLYKIGYSYELNEAIKNKMYKGSSISTNYLDYFYSYILESDAEKKEFSDKMRPLFKEVPPIYQTNVLHAAMQGYDGNVPSFLLHCSQDNHQTTQSEKHFCANISSVMQLMFTEHTIKQKTNAIAMFKRALAKERQELAKGNHVFYHGRKWEYDFWADIDKYTYNLAHPDKPLTDIRLRFDDKQEGALCLNYALFANATRKPSNTASYVVNNHDFSGSLSGFTLNQPFKRFGFEKHFERYKQELEELKKLHAASNKHGSLLMLSVPDKHVDIVYSAEEGSMGYRPQSRVVGNKNTTDIRVILNALKTNPAQIQDGNSDYIEFALRITPDLKDKVRIYPMSQADPAKYKEYTDYRDQLFARIKTDIEKAGGKKS